jgi:single-strand DNA-binding protein
MSENIVRISGRVGRIDIRPTKKGGVWGAIGLAVPTGKDGIGTDWFDVVVFGSLAGQLEQTIQKGAEVLVVGRLGVNGWTNKEGQKQYKVQIYADAVDVISTPAPTGQPRPIQPAAPYTPDENGDIPF